MAGQYTGINTTKTFSYLFSGARRALELAEAEVQGQLYPVMNCLILQAFTVEAYINHLLEGPEDHGMDISFKKGRPSVWEKFEAIANALNMSPTKLEDAYPHVAEILKFRNAMAHGRTESVLVNEVLAENEVPHVASEQQYPSWMRFCEIHNARRGLESVQSLIETVHERAGLGGHPFSTLGSGSFTYRWVDEPIP